MRDLRLELLKAFDHNSDFKVKALPALDNELS